MAENNGTEANYGEEFTIKLNDKVDINVTQLLLLLVECEEEAMKHVYYDDETEEMGSTADTMVIARRNLLEYLRRQRERAAEKSENGENEVKDDA